MGLSFKQLRKVGYNAVKRVAGRDVAEMYAGHVVAGVARHYDKADYEPLTQAVGQWRLQLVADGVIRDGG